MLLEMTCVDGRAFVYLCIRFFAFFIAAVPFLHEVDNGYALSGGFMNESHTLLSYMDVLFGSNFES